MLIETYKGVQINHDAKVDEFYTTIVINTTSSGKKEYLRGSRLQKLRDGIDKFLNTAGKKPKIQKAWLRRDDTYQLVQVVLYNNISKRFMIKRSDKDRPEELGSSSSYRRSEQLYLCCKENDAIVAQLQKAQAEISKIQKTVSCSSGKLIPLSEEHTEEEWD